MDILDVAEAIGSIVERVKTPTIDWKQRALDAEETLTDCIEKTENLEKNFAIVGDILLECGAPRNAHSPYAVPLQTSVRDRAEWLKRKVTALDCLNRKPRATIPEILKAYDDALEKADKNVPLVGWVNRHREVTQQAILAVVELVRKEPAQDPATKSVETGSSAYPIRNFNSLVAEAITLAGGKPGTIHLLDAIAKLSLERDRLRDELKAEKAELGRCREERDLNQSMIHATCRALGQTPPDDTERLATEMRKRAEDAESRLTSLSTEATSYATDLYAARQRITELEKALADANASNVLARALKMPLVAEVRVWRERFSPESWSAMINGRRATILTRENAEENMARILYDLEREAKLDEPEVKP
jgi:hypothetical protein